MYLSEYNCRVKPQSQRTLRSYMPRRLLQFAIGIPLFGLGVSLVLESNLGAASWDVLTQGLSHHLPLTFGMITTMMGALILLCWIPLKQRPGIGTVVNVIGIGIFADIGIAIFPTPTVFWEQVVAMLIGVVVVGIASGLYIGADFGTGPRDGLMVGLHELTGLPIWVVRTALEVLVVVAGWLLGGTVGLGTITFAVLIGPFCQVFMPMFAIRGLADAKAIAAAEKVARKAAAKQAADPESQQASAADASSSASR